MNDQIDLDAYLAEDFEPENGADILATGPEDTGYRTTDYIILTDMNEKGFHVYQVVNRKFGIVEHEDLVLPRSINMMLHFQGHLEQSNADYFRGNVKLIDGGLDDTTDETGGSRLH